MIANFFATFAFLILMAFSVITVIIGIQISLFTGEKGRPSPLGLAPFFVAILALYFACMVSPFEVSFHTVR